jgi:hypothetical protein
LAQRVVTVRREAHEADAAADARAAGAAGRGGAA